MFRAKKRINITIRLTKKLNKEENERNMTLGIWLDDGVKDSGSRACIVAQLIRNKTTDSMSCTPPLPCHKQSPTKTRNKSDNGTTDMANE